MSDQEVRHHESAGADCTEDIETGCCIGCGVDLSGECDECGGRGYHALTCAAIDAAEVA